MATERPWTNQDDAFLLAYGWCVGIEFIARHDLNRTPKEARARVEWLRKNKPDLYAEKWVEAGTNKRRD